MRVKLRRNTPEEEAAINRGIAQDPDCPELTEDFFAHARPAIEILSPDLYSKLTTGRRRGPGKKPTKVQVTLRLDQDVVERLRASGPGWQVRANQALRKIAGSG